MFSRVNVVRMHTILLMQLCCVRYSLNGGIKTVPVPYLPADTTRSVSSTSEYGAGGGANGVASRPTSRHSHRPRGPPSTSGSNSGRKNIFLWENV